jgi:hypothetical protein
LEVSDLYLAYVQDPAPDPFDDPDAVLLDDGLSCEVHRVW